MGQVAADGIEDNVQHGEGRSVILLRQGGDHTICISQGSREIGMRGEQVTAKVFRIGGQVKAVGFDGHDLGLRVVLLLAVRGV